MTGTQQDIQAGYRCPLCPAGCPLEAVPAGPDAYRSGYPSRHAGGCCPRGSCLVELLTHPRRILAPTADASARFTGGLAKAAQAIAAAAGNRRVVFLVDPLVPLEQISAIAAWTDALDAAELSLAIEPQEREMLLGLEASEAGHLRNAEIADCDGFLLIGDVFEANPVCGRGLLDRRREVRRMPVVSVDPAGGSAAKFASHALTVPPCGELDALAALARELDVEIPEAAAASVVGGNVDAGGAAEALAKCTRAGVLISAEYGRSRAWRHIGRLAGLLAGRLGGGVAPQTHGANALMAVRMEAALGATPLAEAIERRVASLVAVGCDAASMLGRGDLEFLAAAAGLDNRTTASARFVLPVAMPGETRGTFSFAGELATQEALLAAPAGIPHAADVVGAIARAMGAESPGVAVDPDAVGRVSDADPVGAMPCDDPPAPLLLVGRSAMHAGCGELTGRASWQQAVEGEPLARISAETARSLGLENLRCVRVGVNGASVTARVHYAPELAPGVVVLSDGHPGVRELNPTRADGEGGGLVAAAVTASLEGAM